MFRENFKDDWIKVGKHYIKPFSVFWWLVRIGQGAFAVGCVFGFILICYGFMPIS